MRIRNSGVSSFSRTLKSAGTKGWGGFGEVSIDEATVLLSRGLSFSRAACRTQVRLTKGSGGVFTPLRPSDAVQAVAAQRMTLRDCRVLEVLIGVAQADALHHRARPHVAHSGERDDLRQCQLLERNPKRGACGLCGEAHVPGVARKTPADL